MPNDISAGGTVTATIDGVEHVFPSGITVLDAAAHVGIDIPTLCSDDNTEAAGACRMCLVEINKRRDAASCATVIEQGMEINTGTTALFAARQMNLRMLANNYPAGPFTTFPDKPFHRLAREYGLTADDFGGCPDQRKTDDSHPYIQVDMSRCIDCFRCVRICAEVPGRFVWQIEDRGTATHIVADSRTNLLESSCISCGACVETCPTGALEDKTVVQRGAATKWTRTTCPYCGVGCELNAGSRDDKLVQMLPVADAPVNKGHLCVKGRYAFDFVDAGDRITDPLIRRNGEWQKATWDEAISFTARRLTEIMQRSGPDSIGVLGSSRATNEDNYVTQKFARACVGTNNVECCARVCHTPSAAGLKIMLGTGAATDSFDGIEHAAAILIVGENATHSHPIVGERLKQAAIKLGTPLIVIDPRRTEIARYADIHLQIRGGTNIPLLNAMANVIIAEGLADTAFISERVTGVEAFVDLVSKFTPEMAAEICGVDAEDIRRAARLYGTAKPAMCFHGLGLTEHVQGTEGVMCVINLALLTGNIGKLGTGVNPLRGQNNVQGAAVMGCDRGTLTGSVNINTARPLFEKVWGAPVPVNRGLDVLEMIDSARAGGLKALWTIGYDLFFSSPRAEDTAEAMRALDLVIVQDMFMNETAREFGHVFLPAATAFEKDGTFMNAERRIQRVRKAVEPRGHSRPDWQIVCDVAAAMGMGHLFAYDTAEQIWDEVRAVWPAVAGVSYERLEHQGIQWPCPDTAHPGTTVLHTDSFSKGKTAEFKCIDHRPSPETTDDEFPFLLNTGRTRYAFNAGTMTGRTPNAELRPTDLLSMNPLDCTSLGLTGGDIVRVTSRYGQALLPLQPDRSVRPGELFATFHDPRVFINHVTSSYRDSIVNSPEYKITAVNIRKERAVA